MIVLHSVFSSSDISEDGSEAVDAGTSNQETMASDELGNQAGRCYVCYS